MKQTGIFLVTDCLTANKVNLCMYTPETGLQFLFKQQRLKMILCLLLLQPVKSPRRRSGGVVVMVVWGRWGGEEAHFPSPQYRTPGNN